MVNVIRTGLYVGASALLPSLKLVGQLLAGDLQGLGRELMLLWTVLFRVKTHHRSEQPSTHGTCAVPRGIIHPVSNSVRMPYFARYSCVVCRSVVKCVIYY